MKIKNSRLPLVIIAVGVVLTVLLVMPAFYIITGYGFNPDKRSVGKSISSRFKALMIPFWVFMIFYTLMSARTPSF